MITEKRYSSSRYLELDALRGLAALLVVFFHFTMNRDQSRFGFNVGVTGVDLFFIISGFVIFMSVNSISSIKEFLINRFTRLYPTYWTCVSFTFVLYLIVNKISNTPSTKTLSEYLVNLTMFQYYFKVPDIDGPYWTMIIEMIFYLFIAITFSSKLLKHIIPIGFLVLLIIASQNLIWNTKLWSGYEALRLAVPLMNYFPLFFSGIIFYKIMTGVGNRLLYYGLLLFAFILQILQLNNGAFITYREHLIMTIIYFGLFILFVNKKLDFLVSGPTLFLGKISFALYLIHQYVSYQVILPLLIDTYHLNFWLAAFICLSVVLVLATLVTYYIEIPLGRRMNNALRKVFKLEKRISKEAFSKNDKLSLDISKKNSLFLGVIIIAATALIVYDLYNPPPSVFTHSESFYLKTFNNKYVDVDESNNNILTANKDTVSYRELFSLLALGNNKYEIYSYSNKFLSAELGHRNEITAIRDKAASWEMFVLCKLDSNRVAFKAENGKYVSVDEKSLQLFAKGDSIGKQEKFEIIQK